MTQVQRRYGGVYNRFPDLFAQSRTPDPGPLPVLNQPEARLRGLLQNLRSAP